MENVQKHRDIKLVTTEKLFRYQNQIIINTKFFRENLLTIEMKRTQALMNKPVYLGLIILEIRKIVMYEFSYKYVTPKYRQQAKLCYMNTDSFIV